MIDEAGIRAQARRRYEDYLSSLVSGETIFPIEIRFGKIRSGEAVERFGELRAELQSLREKEDPEGTRSYRIEWEERRDRLAGNQHFPSRIVFPGADALVTYLGKEKERDAFLRDVQTFTAAFPELRPWIAKKPGRITEHAGDWERIVAALLWIRERSRPGIFLREIPAVEDTKFVERKKGLLRELLDLILPAAAIAPEASGFEERYGFRKAEPLVRLRILDREIARTRLSGLSDLSIPAGDLDSILFPELTTVLVFENKTNFSNADAFLTLPALTGCVAIFGSGFAVRSIRIAEGLTARRILYWGDIDTQGFRILASLRRSFPACESVLMDEETFDRFPEYRADAPAETAPIPNGLTAAEANLYWRLEALERRNRLEQERIPLGWAREHLEADLR